MTEADTTDRGIQRLDHSTVLEMHKERADLLGGALAYLQKLIDATPYDDYDTLTSQAVIKSMLRQEYEQCKSWVIAFEKKVGV